MTRITETTKKKRKSRKTKKKEKRNERKKGRKKEGRERENRVLVFSFGEISTEAGRKNKKIEKKLFLFLRFKKGKQN